MGTLLVLFALWGLTAASAQPEEGAESGKATLIPTATHAQDNPDFELAPNGITVLCDAAEVGDTGEVDGTVYTKRDRDGLDELIDDEEYEKLTTTCTSGITDMGQLFRNESSFNEDISTWDVSSVTNMSQMFQRAEAFDGDISDWETGNVEDMNLMFQSADSFDQDLSEWDVSNVTNMRSMFRDAEAFDQDLSGWDVSTVEDMSRMFQRANSFDGDLSGWALASDPDVTEMFSGADSFTGEGLGSWDVSSVTDMRSMFRDAEAFDQDLSEWDVSNVTDMSDMFRDADSFDGDLSGWALASDPDVTRMFRGADSFTGEGLGSWDVSSMTDMRQMFRGANSFDQDLSDWETGNVEDMNLMFQSADSFDQDLSEWDVSNVTDMRSMFRGADSFDQDLSDWETGNVEDMNLMFQSADSFDQDLSEWDVSNVTNMRQMFQGAISFNGDLSGWDVSGVETMHQMFQGAISFNGDLSGWALESDPNVFRMFTGADSFTGEGLGTWDVSAVTDMRQMFRDADSFDQDLNGWDVSAVEDMSRMFRGAEAFDQDLSEWDVSNVTNMRSMFRDTEAFDQDLSGWVLESDPDVTEMFNGADSFTGEGLGSWDVSSMTDMSQMFLGADSFDQDLSGWDVSNVTDMSSMFGGAEAFDQDLSGWDVSSVAGMFGVFEGAKSFNGDISGWDVSSAEDMMRMFTGAESFDQSLGQWNVTNVWRMTFMLNGTALSAFNYDQTLAGWSELSLQSGITLGASGLHYCSAEEERHSIINEFDWSIQDAGRRCPEPDELAVFPDQAGDAGLATVTVVGSDLTEEFQATLVREGHADIEGETLFASDDGVEMEVRFNLAGQPQGTWDFVVTGPGDFLQTLEDGFTIVEGEEPEVWAAIHGANRLLEGESATVNVNYGNRGGTDVHDVMLYVHLPGDLEFSVNRNGLTGTEVEDWVDPGDIDPDVHEQVDLHIDIDGENRTIIPFWMYLLPVGATGTLTLEITPTSELSRPIEAEIATVSTLNSFTRTGIFEAAAPPLLDAIWTGVIHDAINLGTASAATNPEPALSDGSVLSIQSSNPCTPPTPEERFEDWLDEYEQTRQEFFDTAQELLPSTGDVLLNAALGIGGIAVCAKTAGSACLIAAAAPDALSIKDAYDVVTFDSDDDDNGNGNGNGNGDDDNPCENSDEDNYNPLVQDDIPSGRSFGDPHLMTFDRRSYDFQAVGEFVFTRSRIDALEVQARLEQLAPEFQNFSIVTAVAMNVASDELVFQEDRESFENVPDLQINGAPTDLPEAGDEPMPLPGGGAIMRAGRTLMVEWPDGETRVDVRQSAAEGGMTVEPMISGDYAGHLEGLLGTMDGNPETDFQTRDGTILHHPLSFDELYRNFGDSWRITQEESLFGTETFEDRSIPEKHLTTEDLDPDVVEQAKETCQDHGVQALDLLDNCIFDVVMSGDERYAEDAATIVTPAAKEQTVETMDENDAKLQVLLETTAENQEFAFTGSGVIGPFTLMEDGDASTVTHTQAFHPLSPGSYEVSLDAFTTDGLELLDISCAGVASATTDLNLREASVELAAGDAGRCAFTVLPVELEVDLVRTFDDPTLQENYRLVALPGQVDVDLAETVPGEPGPDWRAFRESGDEALEEYDGSEAFHFRPGKGFWLLAQEAWAFEETVGAVEALADEPAIELTEGWNVISNPLGADLSWIEILDANDLDETLWQWTGSWEEADVLASALEGEAYYFFNEAELDELALTSDGDDDALLAATAKAPSDDEDSGPTLLGLEAYVDESRASGVALGLVADGDDEVAHRAPPAHFEAASLQITDASADGTFTRQVVAGAQHSFALVLEAEPETTVELRATAARELGAVGLELPDEGAAYDLSEEANVTVRFAEGQKQMPVRVQLTAADALDEAVPDELALHPPYPNPARGEVTVGYDLPEPMAVAIEVFNALGQQVALLEEGERTAGTHRLTWNVSTGAGMLPSGTYFVRLRAEGHTETEQFVIVR